MGEGVGIGEHNLNIRKAKEGKTVGDIGNGKRLDFFSHFDRFQSGGAIDMKGE